MITKVMEILQGIFEEELTKKSSYYSDDLIDSIVLRAVDPKDPTPSLGFLVGEARPKDYQIGEHYPLNWISPLQIQLFVKHASEVEGLSLIRLLIRRLFLSLFRETTSQALLVSDSLGALTERVVKYNVVSKNYASAIVSGGFVFAATIEMEFLIEMNIT